MNSVKPVRLGIICFLALGCSGALSARSHHRRARQSSGAFDHYLLTLSWSPEYCHSHPADDQCTGAKHFGFVVHGLWPEYPNGLSGPQNCSQAPGLSDPSKMLDIMPSLRLIGHEWTTHGTCSGLSADDYFGLIRKLFSSLRIPSQFAAPKATLLITGSQTRGAFEQANPGLQDADIALSCTGSYLQAVEICYSTGSSPQPIACPARKDCGPGSIKVPAIR